MTAAAFIAGIFAGASAGVLLAAAIASARVHYLAGQLEHWKKLGRRYALLQLEDRRAEES